MSNISAWSTSASNNNSASPDGFPESMAPSGVNDSAREVMAAVKRWYVDAEWRVYELPAVRQTNNSFIVSATATEVFTAGRRFRGIDAGVTVYGDVVSSGASGANTLVTVSSSALSASLSQISVAILNPAASSLPQMNALTTTASVTASDYIEIFQSGTGLRRRALQTNVVRGAGLVSVAEVDVSGGNTSETLASSIPSWCKRITVMGNGVSSNGTSNYIIQLGDSGGPENSGYTGGTWTHTGATTTQWSSGIIISNSVAAAGTNYFKVILDLQDSSDNTWSALVVNTSSAPNGNTGVGIKALSATLDRVILTTANGTDTFDAGVVSVIYEG